MTSRPSDPRPRPTDPRSRPASLPVGYDGRASSVLPSPTARYPPPRDEQRVQQHQHQPPRRIDDGRSRTSGLINADRPQPYYVSPSPSPAPPAATSPLPAFWQVHPRRRLTADEAFARQAALRRPRRDTAEKRFASLPVEVALRIAYYALRWTGDASYEVGTVSSIFDATRDAKRFSLVSKAWREVAEKALYETVHFNLPRVNPNISAFTAWLREVRWKRERFRHLKTLVVHYGALEACPLVSADPPLRSPIDWHGQAGHLPDKPGQLLKEMRGYRGTLRHLILDAEGDTFLLPIGLENLNWDELTTATYAARRFSHTGVTQNAGRKPPFPFRLLTEARIYTRELDENVLYQVYLYLAEFGPRLKTLHFHWASQPLADVDPTRRVALTLSDLVGLCPNLEELSTEPPDVELPGADVDLYQLRRLVLGRPMVGGQLVERTGQNWHRAAWTTSRLSKQVDRPDGRAAKAAAAERERERVRADERRRATLKATDEAAWD